MGNDASPTEVRSGMLFRQSSSVAGVEIGPRLLIDSNTSLETPGSLSESAAASVALYVDRHTSSSVGIVLKDSMSSSVSMLEWRDSSGNVYGSIGGNSASYRFSASSASIGSASIGNVLITDATFSNFVSGSVSFSGQRVELFRASSDLYSGRSLTIGAENGGDANGDFDELNLMYAGKPTYVRGSLWVAESASIAGNLTVNGTTTTVNSTTITVDDPIITLGGDTAPTGDDNKDRGVEFRYYSGTAASVGFMGYDDSTGMFTFLTGATNTSEVFSGTAASVQVGSLHVAPGTGNDVTLSPSTAEVSYEYGTWVKLVTSSVGAELKIRTAGSAEGIIGNAGSAFTFNLPISSASLSSASINAPVLSGSVHYDSSASVTLPAKTFFPEEYLTVSSSVTLSSTTHRYATLEMTASAGTSVITVPADASDNFTIGSVIQIIRVGAGEVQVSGSAGVTVNNALGSRLRAQWSTATLRKRAANTWLLSGDLKV